LRAEVAPLFFPLPIARKSGIRAYTLREAATRVDAPDKLAHLLGRPRQLIDNWLPVAIPDRLAHAFAGSASCDVGRALLRKKLATLSAWLDARLDEPPEVIEAGPCRQVTVFGCVGYDIDFVARQIRPARVYPNGARQTLCNSEIELLRPVSTGYWLNWVIEDLGLGANVGQISLFCTASEMRFHDEWLVRTAFDLLKSDSRFEGLRKVILPQAFKVGGGLVSLALKSRHYDWAQVGLSSATFNLVWRHEYVFRRVARENPQLLKLLELFLLEKKLLLNNDPVAEIRDYLKAQGCSEASWRYVHKYGSRIFRMAWKMASNRSRVDVAVHYLRELDNAGLPPPPAPQLAAGWFRCFIGLQEDRLDFFEYWCAIDPMVVRAVLVEAANRRQDPAFDRFVGEAINVWHWAMETGLVLNSQQKARGWRWLRGRWLKWCERRKMEAKVENVSWESALRRTAIGRFDVIPIETGLGLVEEALEMRNCVSDYSFQCEFDLIRMFSVRSLEDGKRVATLAIKSAKDLWIPYQVKRVANQPPGRELERLVREVARRYMDCCAVLEPKT